MHIGRLHRANRVMGVHEKIEHFLIDEVGVTEEQIAQIRKIYLED